MPKFTTKTEKRNRIHPIISKLVASSKHEMPLNEYIVKLKNLEYIHIKSLEDSTLALSIVKQIIAQRLSYTNLSNKQKKEVELIALIEAFKTLDSLIRSIENSIN